MANSGIIDPKIFENLQTKIDEDAEVRDQIRTILQTLERQGRAAQSVLSRAHSTPAEHRKTPFLLCSKLILAVQPVLRSAEEAIVEEIASIGKLAEITSSSPYYKYSFPSTPWLDPAKVADIMACGLGMFRMLSSQFYSVDGWEVWE